MKRRRILHAVGVGVSLTAGCLGFESPSTQQSTGTTSSAQQTTEPDPEIRTLSREQPEEDVDCGDEDLQVVGSRTDESYPQRVDALELTASKSTVTIGNEITFSLRNVSDETQSVGAIYKYYFQRRDGDEWAPVYYAQGPGWIDQINAIAPGGGFDWPFTFDREGLERENPGNSTHYVCSPINPGTYRFVFWGVDGGLATTVTAESP